MGSMMTKARDFLGWGSAAEIDDFDAYDEDYYEVEDGASIVEFPAQESEAPTAVAPRTPHVLRESASDVFRIETVHPTSFNDARAIGEYFRKGIPVVVNLTDLPEDEARRVLDFIAGLAFGLQGDADRVTNRVFLLTPHNVQVTDHAGAESYR